MKSAPVPHGVVATPSSPPSPAPRRADVSAATCVSSYDCDGMLALREGRFDVAAQYYERFARARPDDAEGWAGIAASFVGTGDLDRARKYLERAFRDHADTHPPVALMLALGAGTRGDRLIDLARLLQERRTPAAGRAAIAALTPCLATNGGVSISESQRVRVLDMRRDLERLLAAHPAARPASSGPRRRYSRAFHRLVRGVMFLLAAALLALAVIWGWGAVERARSQALVRLALSDYAEAVRIDRGGQGHRLTTAAVADATPLFLTAYAQSRRAAGLDATSVEASFLLAQTGEALLFHAARGAAVPASTVADARVAAGQARAVLKSLDPSGVGQRREQQRLEQEIAR